jgi:hypothetical protein
VYRRKTQKRFRAQKRNFESAYFETTYSIAPPRNQVSDSSGSIRREGMSSRLKTIAIAALTIATALLSIELYAASPAAPKPKPPFAQVWTPGCVASVPKAWGTFRGASTQSGLAFEDSSGTIRFLTNLPCDGIPSVSLEIHRTAVSTQ